MIKVNVALYSRRQGVKFYQQEYYRRLNKSIFLSSHPSGKVPAEARRRQSVYRNTGKRRQTRNDAASSTKATCKKLLGCWWTLLRVASSTRRVIKQTTTLHNTRHRQKNCSHCSRSSPRDHQEKRTHRRPEMAARRHKPSYCRCQKTHVLNPSSSYKNIVGHIKSPLC